MLTAVAANAQTAAPAPSTPPPAYGKLVVTGLFDGYYDYSFNKSSHGLGSYYNGAAVSNPGNLSVYSAGSVYTYRQSSPTLSLAEVNLTSLAAPGGFGYKATLGAGDTAQANAGLAPGASPGSTPESRYENILQLYGAYAFSGSKGGELDFGKFYTPFGYELTESSSNWNYTRSTTYNMLPFYHFGFRLESPSFDNGFSVNLFLVNALYNDASEGVDEKGGGPGYIGQLNYTDPNGKFTFIETIGGGTNKELYAADTTDKSVLSDTDFTYNMDATDAFGLNYTYLNQKPSGTPSTTANGWGVYYRKQLNPKDAFALRYDGYEAKAGAGNGNNATDFKPFDITATYEIKATSSWLTRFEYRYDGANTDTYLGSGSSATVNKENQSSLIASEVFSF